MAQRMVQTWRPCRSAARPRGWAWIAVALLAAVAVGCAEGRTSHATGGVRVSLALAALDPRVTEVVVTIRPGDGPTFEPIVVQLSQGSAGWTASVSGVPAGPGRVTEVVASGAGGAPLYGGSGKADILGGAVAELVVLLGPEAVVAPGANTAPVIDFLSASQGSVPPGASIRLEAGARDPDPYDSVSLTWGASCGRRDSLDRSMVVWRAPAVEQICLVSLTASDTAGASAAVYLPVTVAIPAP